jgi:hypothetical protein
MSVALPYILFAVSAVIGTVIAVYVRRRRRTSVTATPLVQAKKRFHVQRERLEAKFVQLATAHATPDAPQWADCMFDDDVSYVRNRATGELSAFVAVTIASDNLDGALRGATDAVGNLQAGTAVFRFDCDHWETDGRTILNLSPSEAVQHFRNDFEIVAEELANRV